MEMVSPQTKWFLPSMSKKLYSCTEHCLHRNGFSPVEMEINHLHRNGFSTFLLGRNHLHGNGFSPVQMGRNHLHRNGFSPFLNNIVNEAVTVEVDEKDTNSEGSEKQENEVESIRNEYREKLELKDKHHKQILDNIIEKHHTEITELKDNQRNAILKLNDQFVQVRKKSEELRSKNENLKVKHNDTLENINQQFINVRKEKDELRKENMELKEKMNGDSGSNTDMDEQLQLQINENDRVIAIANKIVNKLQKDKKEMMDQLVQTNQSFGEFVKKHEILAQENKTHKNILNEQIEEQEKLKGYLIRVTGKSIEEIEISVDGDDQNTTKEDRLVM
jgi:hypothetical protein